MSRLERGAVAALPLAAGATLLLADWLPIRFAYRENAFGIVSRATLERYPHQQEIFWALFAGVAGGALAVGFAHWLGRGMPEPRVRAGFEALAVAALAALLWLPGVAAPLAFAALAAGAFVLSGRRSDPGWPDAAPAPASRARPALLALGAIVLSFLLAPGVWENLWSVAHRVPDEQVVGDHFKFLAEKGQHLAWADALRRGELHGRDFFCLYGPLYDLGIAGFWQLVGRSVSGYELYESLTRVLGWSALFALGWVLLRRSWLTLLLPFLLPWVELRVGLPLFGLACLALWLRGGRTVWSALAGAFGGAAVFFSQEFGASFLLVAALGLALGGRRARGAAAFVGGAAAVVAPLLFWYALAGALGPMLADLFAYPRYMLAGYGKLPFPALAPALPLDPLAPLSGEALALRAGYAAAAILVGGALLLLLPGFELRHPLRSLARDPERLALLLVVLFGIAAFRSALGRSELSRTVAVLPPVALLVACGFDRCLALAGRAPALRPVAFVRALALAFLLVCAGFAEVASPFALVRTSLSDLTALSRGVPVQRGSREVVRVTRWIQLHAEPGEPVLFFPNDAAYYYLTERPPPIRFVLGHQMVTDAHRAEVLADLRARPPRFVVWNHGALRVDGVPDEAVFGRDLLGWIEDGYETETRLGDVEILRRREGAP